MELTEQNFHLLPLGAILKSELGKMSMGLVAFPSFRRMFNCKKTPLLIPIVHTRSLVK